MDYKDKYIKYKTKYLELKNINNYLGGGKKMKKRNKGYGNKNILNMENKKYSVSVSEPWFSLILLGLKTVEGRKNRGLFAQMQDGDIVEWMNDSIIPRSVQTRITGKAVYPTFREYLEIEGLDKCLPGISDMDDGLSIYYKYFTKEEEKEFGVVAIHLELLS